ncbi:MAG: lysine--tRNA ligase [Planctomycetota bacterium]
MSDDSPTATLNDDSTPSADKTGDDRLEAARREKLRRIAELGHDPWGGRFDDRELIGDIRARVAEVKLRLEDGTEIDLPEPDATEDFNYRQWLADQGKGEITGPKVRAAGRIMLSRDAGKLRFVNIQDWTGTIQLFIGKNQVGDANWELSGCFDLGDLVGVDGELRRTKTGELTIFAEKLHFLGKSLAQPPEKHHGITDVELRQRMRYLDLAYTEGVRDRFLRRTKIVHSIRQTLNGEGFCEIEGPTLHSIAGGAAARPFTTHHNALDLDLFMRIALELHLKRLLVGGMERVYELGRVYRNEGISPRHNPEFTMIEVYQAYGDYRSMMDLTEKMIVNAIDAIGGGYQLPWGDETIDFTPPFARKTYDELFAAQTGVDPTDEAAVAALAKSLGFDPSAKHPDVVKNFVFEEKVEDSLKGPIFVIDYPASICPLTKRKRSNPAIAERFELFIEGMEIANAYTELNDPDLQEELFKTQLAGLAAEDSMAKMDHDFIRALRHGMPPAGGLGVGIDRLVMLLTNSQTIRDVILFPLLRPEG